jgi:hypothetical protein
MTATHPISPILTPAEYGRMVGIISSVIAASGAEPSRGCISFAVAGSWILRQVHGKNAYPVAGAAFYRVDDSTGFTMAYGHYLQGNVISNEAAFHSWIVSEGQVIDLAAPLIPDNLALSGRPEVAPRRMLQRAHDEMAASPEHLMREGDFYLEPNLPLSEKLFSIFLNDPTYLTLAEVCADWYELSCHSDAPTFEIAGKDGPRKLRRHEVDIQGSW